MKELAKLAIQIDHQIQIPASVVWSHLSDLHQFGKVHPIICKVEEYGNGLWRLYERLPLGPFSFRFSYPVRLTVDAVEQIVRYQSTVLGLVSLDIRFHVRPDPASGSITHEVIEIKSRFPLERYVASECEKYHRMVFENIEKVGRG